MSDTYHFRVMPDGETHFDGFTITYTIVESTNPLADAMAIPRKLPRPVVKKVARIKSARHSTFWRWLFRKPCDVFTVQVRYDFAKEAT